MRLVLSGTDFSGFTCHVNEPMAEKDLVNFLINEIVTVCEKNNMKIAKNMFETMRKTCHIHETSDKETLIVCGCKLSKSSPCGSSLRV